MNLTSADDLAAQFGVTIEKLHDLRKRYHWPCVHLGRFDIRFTEAQIEQIVAMHSEAPKPREQAAAPAAGLTARSAARRRSA
jgi:hypothetical protein